MYLVLGVADQDFGFGKFNMWGRNKVPEYGSAKEPMDCKGLPKTYIDTCIYMRPSPAGGVRKTGRGLGFLPT